MRFSQGARRGELIAECNSCDGFAVEALAIVNNEELCCLLEPVTVQERCPTDVCKFVNRRDHGVSTCEFLQFHPMNVQPLACGN
ncbi:MAG: hypothetical protein ACO3WU_10940 [Ilumatobacteraceae bacterium]